MLGKLLKNTYIANQALRNISFYGTRRSIPLANNISLRRGFSKSFLLCQEKKFPSNDKWPESANNQNSEKVSNKKVESNDAEPIPLKGEFLSNADQVASSTIKEIETPPCLTVEELSALDEQEDTDEYPESHFLTTIFDGMEPYMDTYSVYLELTNAGFTPAQADEIINLVATQINSKLSKLSTKYSQLYELENERYLFESAQEELRVDITRSREQHINELISLTNILERDFNVISDELNNDFIQMKNESQVAINDQKSENTLMSRKVMLKIQETNHKITTELNSAMRSEIESLRWNLSRWGIFAILVALFSVCSAFYVYRTNSVQKDAKNEFVPLVIYEPSEFDEDDYHTDLDRSIVG